MNSRARRKLRREGLLSPELIPNPSPAKPNQKKRAFPGKVCLIGTHLVKNWEDRDPGKRYICPTRRTMRHTHLTLAQAALMVGSGDATWVGRCHSAIVYIDKGPVEWRKVGGIAGRGNARLAAMQMIRGGEKRFPRMLEGGLISPR